MLLLLGDDVDYGKSLITKAYMKLGQKIRKIWYDWFYKNATKERFEFALRCQDVTAGIDLHERPKTLKGQFRFWLHLSLCQACKNYYDVSKALGGAVRKRKPVEPIKIKEMNNELLEKYGAKNKSNSVR